MADKITCVVCGGKDFYKEAGYMYCNECQTQTQEFREQEYVFEETLTGIRKSKAIIAKTKTSKVQRLKLTSWEAHNYVLAGLAEELVSYGAPEALKELTYLLWMLYLRKIGIISKRKNSQPQLGLTQWRKDAEIAYNVKKRKRKKKTSSVVSSSSNLSHHKEALRRKRALIRADYESQSQSRSETRSLTNVTLSEVTDSDVSSETSFKLNYNQKAKRVLKQKRISLRNSGYWDSIWALRRDKLYGLLCIAAQLLKADEWLPGGMFRACQDGHVSFVSYAHFFPPGCEHERAVSRGNGTIPSQKHMRVMIYEVAQFLDINLFDFTPSLVKIASRYCAELNLPDEIKNAVINLILETHPKFKNSPKKPSAMPNYEGRTMAFILFVLKLLYNLDGITECKLSSFAQKINTTQNINEENMFIFTDWIKYIEYRKHILKNLHLPTSFSMNNSGINHLKLFCSFLRQHKTEDEEKSVRRQVIDKLLKDLEIFENVSYQSCLNLPYSPTPSSYYLQKVLENDDKLINDVPLQKELLKNYTDDKLDYIFHYKDYLKQIYGKNYLVLKRSAHNNFIYTEISADSDKPIRISKNEKIWKNKFETNKFEYLSIDKLENLVLHKKLKLDPEVLPVQSSQNKINIASKNNKNSLGRDSKGRFCQKDSPQNRCNENYHSQRKRGKWFISSWNENPVLQEKHYNGLYRLTNFKSLECTAKRLLKNDAQTETIKGYMSDRVQKMQDIKQVSKNKFEENKSELVFTDKLENLVTHQRLNGDSIQVRQNEINIDLSSMNDSKNNNISCDTMKEDISEDIQNDLRYKQKAKKRSYTDIDKIFYTHFLPHQEYWLLAADVESLKKDEWRQLHDLLPVMFRWLLAELARTAGIELSSLYHELVLVELYVCFVHLQISPNNSNIVELIRKFEDEW